MKFIAFTAAILCISINASAAAQADELPTNLLMKCEGKLTVFLSSQVMPDTSQFSTTLRLKNGELSDTDKLHLTTKGCELRNNIIYCEAKSVVPILTMKGSARRELTSFIDRETGEYNLLLEEWDFEWPNASGKQTGHMKWHRVGICRTVSKPIF